MVSQFLTKEEYQRQEHEKKFPTKLNPLIDLEAEVKLEGFSLYRVPSEIIDARDEETGLTKLMLHANRGIKDECKHVIVQGANLELTNRLGETALLIAVSKGNYHSAVELLKGHANMHHRSNLGVNALHTAIATGLPTLVEAILRTDDSWRYGVWKSEYHLPPIADTTMLPTGMTPVMMCSQDGQEDMVKLLLEYGCSVNLRSKSGETALMYSSIIGHAGIVKLLLLNGADPNMKNDFGFTALIMAANRGHMDVIHLFIERDERQPQQEVLEVKDKMGNTALDHAIMSSQQEVVDALMAAGVTLGKKNAWIDHTIMKKRRYSLDKKQIKAAAEKKMEDDKRAREGDGG